MHNTIKNNQPQSVWKLLIVSPLLVVFFLLFQVETKAQVPPSVNPTKIRVNKVEITYDTNTTIDVIESDVSFLKEDFDIDMTFSDAKFGVNGKLISIFLSVETNEGFSGSVSSSDVASRPVYFFRDFSEDTEVPFGVGTRSKTEMDSKMDYETIKNAEIFIINGKKIDKEELVGNYIPVETSSYNNKSKTLSVTTKSEFSQPYFSDISDLLKELKTTSTNRVLDEFIYIRLTSEYKVTMMKISDFKISDNVSRASKNDDSQKRKKFNDENIVFILDGKKIDESQMTDIDPKEIDSINVVKSKEDLKAAGYNPNFVDGLIKITSKKVNTTTASESENSYDAFRSSLSNKESTLYIVDGKEVDKKKISEINHNQIESVFIIKSIEAIEEAGFDPKKVDGLIKITTKKEVKE